MTIALKLWCAGWVTGHLSDGFSRNLRERITYDTLIIWYRMHRLRYNRRAFNLILGTIYGRQLLLMLL